jgi:hypothetical protein
MMVGDQVTHILLFAHRTPATCIASSPHRFIFHSFFLHVSMSSLLTITTTTVGLAALSAR